MHALILALLFVTAEPVRVQLDWRGGDPDLAPQAAESPLQDANADTAGPVSAQKAASVSLKQAIAAYRRNGGVRYFVRGKTDAQHVVEDHGWTYAQIRGLTHDEIQYLHGASHTGKLQPSSFGAPVERPAGAPPSPAGSDSRPRLTITVAPFHCPPCNQVKRMDWSGFDVDWRTGGHVERGYPEISWRDESGKKWWKAGAYRPDQIMGLVERTQ